MLVVNAKVVRKLMIDLDIHNVPDLAARCKPPLHKNTVYDMLNRDWFNSRSVDALAAGLGVSALSLLTEVEERFPLEGLPDADPVRNH